MTFLIGNYPSLENLKRNDTEGELTLESVGTCTFVRISLQLGEHLEIFATWLHVRGLEILAESVFVGRLASIAFFIEKIR